MYLGLRNKSATFILPLLLITSYATGQAVHKHKYVFETRAEQTKITSSFQSITINYSIQELDAESLVNEQGEWYRIAIPGHIKSADTGKPEVPVLSRLIVIPDGYSCSARISGVESSRIRPALKKFKGKLFPAQESESKDSQQPGKKFLIDKNTYSLKEFIRSDTVSIRMLGRTRGRNLANLAISPVRYNPGSNIVEVITSMNIEIIFTPDGSTATKSPATASSLFTENLEKGILNYGPEDYIPGFSDKPVRMVILTDTAFLKHLQPFIEWKTQKGFRLDLLFRGADFAGTTYAELKSTLSTLYNSSTEDNPPPEYLLIVGDVSHIPYYGTTTVTDMYYAEYDGNGDYFPEMYTGRLPVADTNELKSVVSKIIQYEKFQYADTNLFHSRALATAGVDDSHSTYMNGQVNYAVLNYLTPANNISEYHFLYPNAKKDTILKLIDQGLSFINYTGHGTSTGWLYLGISTSDIVNLKNKDMYPFIISNACQTSRFSTASLGNRMVLTKEKGGIGFIGCSSDSYWDEDYYWAVGVGPVALEPAYESTGLGALDRLFHTHGENSSDWYFTMGQVNYAGNLSVSASTSSRKKYYWETYNLVGDPSIIPITGSPETFNILLPDTLPNNITSYSFISEPYSYVAVSHFDTLWDAKHTSPSGSVSFQMPGLSDDSCLVVITGQNRIPLIKKIYFTEINNSFVNLSGLAVNDSLGNNNGIADYNETIFLRLNLENRGSEGADAVSAEISTASGYINILSSSSDVGTLPPGSEKIIYNDLSFKIFGDIPDNHTVTFDLILRYGTVEKLYKVDVKIYAPVLSITHYQVDDSETGNNNFIADPGETLNLVFSVINQGTSTTSGLFSISSSDQEITIIESGKNSGFLNYGEEMEIPLKVKIAESVPIGTSINITTYLDCDPYIASRTFTLKVGRIQETFESASFKVFPWINISPTPWIITGTDRYEGIISARSGPISDNQSTSLAIKVIYDAVDTLKFYYKVSSEKSYDHLIFKVNDNEILRASGEVPWTLAETEVPAGNNKFEWIYRKDGSVGEGSDCAFIDLIDFTGTSPVTYIGRDLVAARLVSPVQKTNIGREFVTIKLLNNGPDTIDGFNLAYSINGSIPVVQHFTEKLIYNSDSVSVTFSARADLSHFGEYNILVYSFNNSDDFLLNDTLKAKLMNNNIEGPYLVYPNPFREELNIIIKSDVEDTVRLSLTNSEGKRMRINSNFSEDYDLEYPLSTGTNPITIRPLQLSQGVYYLKIELSGSTRTLKVLKIIN